MNSQSLCATVAVLAVALSFPGVSQAQAQTRAPGTPAELVAAYDALADSILGGIKAERKLVHAILAATYAHARIEAGRAREALKAKDAGGAKAAVENLAAAVGQIGTEGDNAVAGVRKRLVEGGHLANPQGQAPGAYDEGYVVVTRTAKKAFLDASQAIAKLAAAPNAEALDAEWKKVEAAWTQHIAPSR